MHKFLAPVVLLASLSAGCMGSFQKTSAVPAQELTIFEIGRFGAYIVDPNTEICALYVGQTIVPVDCAKLARTVPATAAAMTWRSRPSEKHEEPATATAAPAAVAAPAAP